MAVDQITLLLGLIVGSFSVALLVLYGLSWLDAQRNLKQQISLASDQDETVFLFDDEVLVNSTEKAKALLKGAANVGSDWSRFLSVLISRFPNLQSEISELADKGHLVIESKNGASMIKCEWKNGLARLSLIEDEATFFEHHIDRHSIAALEQEVEEQRRVNARLPYLVWRENSDGKVIWANTAYVDYAASLSADKSAPKWPPQDVFESSELDKIEEFATERLKAKTTTDAQNWFEVSLLEQGTTTLFCASAADKTMRAEAALEEFTQTLTKTFSHLTTGLAIFDKNRNLAMFNPALTDLTKLPTEFLVGKPSLTSFLDQMRNGQMMPEPKDYKSWRDEIAALESAAEDGSYEDVWTLPDGATYKVSGRPHPDGAIAFLFEDITAEMSLTRQFRSELETSQAVFDSLPEAIAVFSKEGALVMANTAYVSLWGEDPFEGMNEVTIREASLLWHSKCAPTALWATIRDIVTQPNERSEKTSSTRLWDGRRLICRCTPLQSGQTLVGFKPETAQRKIPMLPRAQADKSYVNL